MGHESRRANEQLAFSHGVMEACFHASGKAAPDVGSSQIGAEGMETAGNFTGGNEETRKDRRAVKRMSGDYDYVQEQEQD